MIDNMEFVYSLSCEGNVFYIGRAKDLAKRYKRHLSGREWLTVHKHIKELLASNKAISMNMLYYLPREEAVRKESEIIHLITKAGHELCNCVGVYYDSSAWDKKPIDINRQTMVEYLKKIQASKESIHLFWQEHNNKKAI